MKVLHRAFTRGGDGSIKLVPEEGEDMWHLFNLIRKGDHVTATTFRKVQVGGPHTATSERIKLKLTIAVEGVEFEPEGMTMRLQGKNLTETEHVKLGAYHTLELDLQRPCTISKQYWDGLDLQRIHEASDPAASADLAIVLISEGSATLCLVGSSTTLVKARIEVNLPRKKGAAAASYDKSRDSFFSKVFRAVVESVNWEVVRCLVIAGPGFTKDEFLDYLNAQAVKQDFRPLILNKQRILTAPAGSTYKHSINDVLTSPVVANQIKDTKAAREVRVLAQFLETLATDPARAFYGPGHVKAAQELGAIDTLLLSDSLFRVNDIAKRKKYAQLVDDVEAAGGTVVIFSDMHVSGEQLRNLTGVAAILRFPLPDLEDAELGHEL